MSNEARGFEAQFIYTICLPLYNIKDSLKSKIRLRKSINTLTPGTNSSGGRKQCSNSTTEPAIRVTPRQILSHHARNANPKTVMRIFRPLPNQKEHREQADPETPRCSHPYAQLQWCGVISIMRFGPFCAWSATIISES